MESCCDELGDLIAFSKETESPFFKKLRHGKRQEIYDLIEEIIETEPKKEVKKKEIKIRSRNSKLFEGRNIIKKVKTHCLKQFYKAVKDCADLKEKISTNFRLKIHEKKNVYKIFKSDISKFRNKVLLNHKMRVIMKNFSNININEKTQIKEGKKELYNYLMGCTWIDILNHVKHRTHELLPQNQKNPDSTRKIIEVFPKEVNEYLDYIKNGSANYKERVNLDKNYLKIFDPIIQKNCDPVNDSVLFQQDVFDLIKKHNCIS